MAADLNFFNRLSGILDVTLSKPVEALSERMPAMSKAPPEATVKDVKLQVQVYEDGKGDDPFRPVTDAELDAVILDVPELRLKGLAGVAVTHKAPNGSSFRCRDLIAAVEETERQTRGTSEWFGGVDVHHVFFEGIHRGEDDTWEIFWGS